MTHAHGFEHKRRGRASSRFVRRAVSGGVAFGRALSGLAVLTLALLLTPALPAPSPAASFDFWSGEWELSVEETAKLRSGEDKENFYREAARPEMVDSFAAVTAVPGKDAFTFVVYITDGKGRFVEKPGAFSVEKTAEDGLLRGKVLFADNPKELVVLGRVLREGSLISISVEGRPDKPPYVFAKRESSKVAALQAERAAGEADLKAGYGDALYAVPFGIRLGMSPEQTRASLQKAGHSNWEKEESREANVDKYSSSVKIDNEFAVMDCFFVNGRLRGLWLSYVGAADSGLLERINAAALKNYGRPLQTDGTTTRYGAESLYVMIQPRQGNTVAVGFLDKRTYDERMQKAGTSATAGAGKPAGANEPAKAETAATPKAPPQAAATGNPLSPEEEAELHKPTREKFLAAMRSAMEGEPAILLLGALEDKNGTPGVEYITKNTKSTEPSMPGDKKYYDCLRALEKQGVLTLKETARNSNYSANVTYAVTVNEKYKGNFVKGSYDFYDLIVGTETPVRIGDSSWRSIEEEYRVFGQNFTRAKMVSAYFELKTREAWYTPEIEAVCPFVDAQNVSLRYVKGKGWEVY